MATTFNKTTTFTITTKVATKGAHLHRDLRQVVWVTKRGCHVEAEARRVLDDAVTKPHAVNASLLEQEFQKEGLEGRVEVLADVLDEHRQAKLDRVLERSDVLSTSGPVQHLNRAGGVGWMVGRGPAWCGAVRCKHAC